LKVEYYRPWVVT